MPVVLLQHARRVVSEKATKYWLGFNAYDNLKL